LSFAGFLSAGSLLLSADGAAVSATVIIAARFEHDRDNL
jgi:hypothetical protein